MKENETARRSRSRKGEGYMVILLGGDQSGCWRIKRYRAMQNGSGSSSGSNVEGDGWN